MTKGSLASLVAVICVAVAGGILVDVAARSSASFAVTETTAYLDLAQKLEQKNYTFYEEIIDDSSNSYVQKSTTKEGLKSKTTIVQSINGQRVEFYEYSFANYERESLLTYNVRLSNISNSVINANDLSTYTYSASKQYAEYAPCTPEIANLMLIDKAGKIAPQNTNTSLKFFGGNLHTVAFEDGKYYKTLLTNIGTTKVGLPAKVFQHGINADWNSQINFDSVQYEKQQSHYEVALGQNAWLYDASLNIRGTINGFPVKKITVDSSLNSHFGKSIFIGRTSVGGQVKSTDKSFEYDFSDFVEKGGAVHFTDKTFQRVEVGENTPLETLANCVNTKNYTHKKTTETFWVSGTSETVVETTKFLGNQYIKETARTELDETYVTVEYGVCVGGNSYVLRYTNFDTNGVLFLDGQLHMSYFARVDPRLQKNVGTELLDLLKEQNGQITLNPNRINIASANLSFENGGPKIQKTFLDGVEDTYTSYGTQTMALYTLGATNVEIPNFVVAKVLERDPSNPLNQ